MLYVARPVQSVSIRPAPPAEYVAAGVAALFGVANAASEPAAASNAVSADGAPQRSECQVLVRATAAGSLVLRASQHPLQQVNSGQTETVPVAASQCPCSRPPHRLQQPCCFSSRSRPVCCVGCARSRYLIPTIVLSALRANQTASGTTTRSVSWKALATSTRNEVKVPQPRKSKWRCMACAEVCAVCVPAAKILNGEAFYRCGFCKAE